MFWTKSATTIVSKSNAFGMRNSRARSRSRPNRGQLLIYQEPEVEGTSGADADIIKNTKEQGEDIKEDKIQPNLEPQAQSEYQSRSQSQVEADDEDNRDDQALALLFADIVKIPCKEKSQRQDKLQI